MERHWYFRKPGRQRLSQGLGHKGPSRVFRTEHWSPLHQTALKAPSLGFTAKMLPNINEAQRGNQTALENELIVQNRSSKQ